MAKRATKKSFAEAEISVDASPPLVGHNNHPFDPAEIVDLDSLAAQIRDTYRHLFLEQQAHLDSSTAWLERVGQINSAELDAEATEICAQLLGLIDAYHGKPDSAHTLAKAPFLKGGRIVDDVLNKELAEPLRNTVLNFKKHMKVWKDAEVARQQRELREAAAEAARKMQAQIQANKGSLEDALEAEQTALDAAAELERPVAQLSQARGDLGGVSGLRGKWKARVLNPKFVPGDYLMPDMELIELAMNRSKDKKTGAPTINIAGVEFYFDTDVTIRR